MAGAERLYTPELLGLAVALADYPLDAGLPYRGSARSRSCGSTLEAGLALDPQGRVQRLGLRVRACAAAACPTAQARTRRPSRWTRPCGSSARPASSVLPQLRERAEP